MSSLLDQNRLRLFLEGLSEEIRSDDTSLYETAAFYGAPLSVQSSCHYDLRLFVDLVLKEGEGRLRNLLPLILAKQAERHQGVFRSFDLWASQDPSFQACWNFTQLALRQIIDLDWGEEDRNRWRELVKKANGIGIEPERALSNLRRYLGQPTWQVG